MRIASGQGDWARQAGADLVIGFQSPPDAPGEEGWLALWFRGEAESAAAGDAQLLALGGRIAPDFAAQREIMRELLGSEGMLPRPQTPQLFLVDCRTGPGPLDPEDRDRHRRNSARHYNRLLGVLTLRDATCAPQQLRIAYLYEAENRADLGAMLSGDPLIAGGSWSHRVAGATLGPVSPSIRKRITGE